MNPGQTAGRGRVWAWAQLFRLPNLFTVPAEPLAGFVLALSTSPDSWTRLGWAMVAALAFYLSGLAWNDYYDYAEDRRQRPHRPLPAGQIPLRTAYAVAWFTASLGLLFCVVLGGTAIWIGGGLLVAVFFYNRWGKTRRVVGVALLGLCRGLSMWLGASAVPAATPWAHAPLWMATVGIAAYIAAVSLLAQREAATHQPGWVRWAPLFVWVLVALCYAPFVSMTGWIPGAYGLLVLGGAITAWHAARRLQPFTAQPSPRIKEVLPPWIGRLIALNCWWSTAVIIGAGPDLPRLWLVAALGACWFGNRWTGRWFYAS